MTFDLFTLAFACIGFLMLALAMGILVVAIVVSTGTEPRVSEASLSAQELPRGDN